MGSLHSLLRTHWDHEPLRLTEARSGPRVCDPQPARFMESTLSFFACIGTMNGGARLRRSRQAITPTTLQCLLRISRWSTRLVW